MNIKATSEENTSTPLVSIIIPVHNAALYLESCLQSVCQQIYSNIEIIIVNDGNTDHSLSSIQMFIPL